MSFNENVTFETREQSSDNPKLKKRRDSIQLSSGCATKFINNKNVVLKKRRSLNSSPKNVVNVDNMLNIQKSVIKNEKRYFVKGDKKYRYITLRWKFENRSCARLTLTIDPKELIKDIIEDNKFQIVDIFPLTGSHEIEGGIINIYCTTYPSLDRWPTRSFVDEKMDSGDIETKEKTLYTFATLEAVKGIQTFKHDPTMYKLLIDYFIDKKMEAIDFSKKFVKNYKGNIFEREKDRYDDLMNQRMKKGKRKSKRRSNYPKSGSEWLCNFIDTISNVNKDKVEEWGGEEYVQKKFATSENDGTFYLTSDKNPGDPYEKLMLMYPNDESEEQRPRIYFDKLTSHKIGKSTHDKIVEFLREYHAKMEESSKIKFKIQADFREKSKWEKKNDKKTRETVSLIIGICYQC